MPTPAAFLTWLASMAASSLRDVDNPLVGFESFSGLERVRPGSKDSKALKRRVGYKGKDRHAAGVDGHSEACNKAF